WRAEMRSARVALHGHIIDSLLLPKVLDEITTRGGSWELEQLEVGRRREDLSHAALRLEAPDAATLEEILAAIQAHGATPIAAGEAQLEPAPAEGVFPPGFFVTSNQPTEIRHRGRWLPVEPVRMDCGVAIDPAAGSARAVRFPQVRKGDRVVVG